jgi:hypothetical protein
MNQLAVGYRRRERKKERKGINAMLLVPKGTFPRIP